MLLGLLRSQDSWLVKSNAETGDGYSDISIQTRERVGMIIGKKYAEGLKRRGAKKIIKYGIAFYVAIGDGGFLEIPRPQLQ